VISRHDGDVHFVSGKRLAELYKVDPSECIFVDEPKKLLGLDVRGLKVLRPDPSGEYPHPDAWNAP
jgi:hypothetical protein